MNLRSPVVLCCYSGDGLRIETERSVKKFAPKALFVDTSGGDYSYRDALWGHWNGTNDLIVIEQDMVITRGVVSSFRRCFRHDWCVYSYQGPPAHGFLYRSLGCTRFSARLQREHPFSDFPLEDMTWKFTDVGVARVLWDKHRIVPHVHGHLQHLHDYASELETRLEAGLGWLLEYNLDGTTHPTCKELSPDGRTVVYYINEDGSRGPFKREIPPMPRYATPPGYLRITDASGNETTIRR